MCIGLRFADIQIKLVLAEMLKQYSWQVAEGYGMPVQQSPISKPTQATLKTWGMLVDDEPQTGIWHQRYYVPGSKYSNMPDAE
jgi:hypothetical protein